MTLDSHIWAPPVPQLLGSRAKPFAQVETASKTRVEMRPRRDPPEMRPRRSYSGLIST